MTVESQHSRYWKTVVDTMADGLMIVDARGVILSVNEAFVHLTGYAREDLIGKKCDERGCDACSTERAEGADKYCALFKEGRIRRSRCTLHKKNGEPLYVMKNASILRDEAGAVIGGVETITDLSETMACQTVITDLRKELQRLDGFHGIIGSSAAMQQLFSLVSSAAQSDAPVIIYGESGTGKELVAHAIHQAGPREKGPFVKVNCAALNESLLESELFGHVKGAFTGADRTRIGRFEAAHRGSIFLDEIGELPLSTQVRLLRVLQEKEIERVGDNQPIPVDVRIICATHRNLREMIENDRFREDLYYRISVIPIHLPPLRERREDIPKLIGNFIHRIQLKNGAPNTTMSAAAMEILNAYPWPGNVRELMNVIEFAFVLCPNGVIEPHHLPQHILESRTRAARQPAPEPRPAPRDERKELIDALDRAGGNKSLAARFLEISRVALYKRLKKHNISIDRRIMG